MVLRMQHLAIRERPARKPRALAGTSGTKLVVDSALLD